jgi:hypothetical protein
MKNPLLDPPIDCDKSCACVRGIKSSALTAIATTFANNTRDIDDMLILPSAFLKRGIYMGFRIGEANSSVGRNSRLELSQAEQLCEQILRSWPSEAKDDEFSAVLDSAVSQDISHLTQSSQPIRACIDLLLRASVASAWTMFECLAADTWEVLVNSRPRNLIGDAVSHRPGIEEKDYTARKGISVGDLIKHDFDLRNCLGSLLKGRYNFTGMDEIGKAYFAIFPSNSPSCLDLARVVQNHDLYVLQACRNLIVHRGGLVDEAFKRMTKYDFPGYALGTPLPIDGPLVSKLVNASITCGCDLLTFADDFLLRTEQ